MYACSPSSEANDILFEWLKIQNSNCPNLLENVFVCRIWYEKFKILNENNDLHVKLCRFINGARLYIFESDV